MFFYFLEILFILYQSVSTAIRDSFQDTSQKLKSMDAQVPYIKWNIICI